ncbi:MAG: hypothetical protein R2731_07520 [Nocardioides sp.]
MGADGREATVRILRDLMLRHHLSSAMTTDAQLAAPRSSTACPSSPPTPTSPASRRSRVNPLA